METDGVEIRYAHSGRRDAADDEIVGIVRIVEDHGEREMSRVVTSDRDLRERVRALGAQPRGRPVPVADRRHRSLKPA